MNKHTSFEFSKLLWENGCRLYTTHIIYQNRYDETITNKSQIPPDCDWGIKVWYCYDILWDICVKYAKEFFGDEEIKTYNSDMPYDKSNIFLPINILRMILLNISQEEVEKYIWDNCLFNPKNKGE